MRLRALPCCRGLSLLELILVAAVGLLLATMVIPISATFKERAEKAKCLSHMRTLHTCFVAHISDKGSWPQLTESKGDMTEDLYFRFWIKALEPYGAAGDTWLCPSDKVLLKMKAAGVKKEQHFGTYVPTPFEPGPSIPFRWNQPWVIERGDFHGKGAHMLMPDGSVHDSQNPFYGR